MNFLKNQNIYITKENDKYKIVAGQSKSTPGIYKYFRVQPGKSYKVKLEEYSNNGNMINLWIAMDKKTLYIGKAQELIIKFDNIRNNIIKIGLLYSRCKIGDYFIIKDIKLDSCELDNILYISGNNKIIMNFGGFIENNFIVKKNEHVKEKIKNIYWENKEDKKEIIMTVALPAYAAENIIWLALESLRNQRRIDFGWELIIWEEYGRSYDIVESFIGKFPGCERIIYKALGKKILLIDKWLGIVKSAASTSKVFVMQAADDYSPPLRLHIHNEHFKDPRCYFSTQKRGLFYDINSRKKIFYIGTESKKNHLNMAYRIDIMRMVRRVSIYEGVDNYIKKTVEIIMRKYRNKKISHAESVDKNNWKYGFFTDGYNTISIDRKRYYDFPTDVFYGYINGRSVGYTYMEEYIPANVMNFLNELRNKKKNI